MARFQGLVEKDHCLAIQTILDPVGTLSKFGLIEDTDNDLHMQLTKGTLADIVHLREAVAARGLASITTPPPPAREEALRIVITVSVTFTWDGVRVTVTVTVVF